MTFFSKNFFNQLHIVQYFPIVKKVKTLALRGDGEIMGWEELRGYKVHNEMLKLLEIEFFFYSFRKHLEFTFIQAKWLGIYFCHNETKKSLQKEKY